MFVVTKIGNSAGKVIDMDAPRATALIARGQARRATPEEIMEAGFDEPANDVKHGPGTSLPHGYKAEFDEAEGGVILTLIGTGDQIGEPFRNLLEARSAANRHASLMSSAEKERVEAKRVAAIIIPDGWREMTDAICLRIAQDFDADITETEAARLFLNDVQNERRAAEGLPALHWKTGAEMTGDDADKPRRKPFQRREKAA